MSYDIEAMRAVVNLGPILRNIDTAKRWFADDAWAACKREMAAQMVIMTDILDSPASTPEAMRFAQNMKAIIRFWLSLEGNVINQAAQMEANKSTPNSEALGFFRNLGQGAESGEG